MGWDAEPPSRAELAPVAWDAEPPKPEEMPHSAGDFAGNFLSDVAQPLRHPLDTLSGMGEQIKSGAMDYPKEATDTLAQVVGNTVAGQPIGETPMAKRASGIAASPMVQNPGEELYQHPGNAAMLAAPFVGAFWPEGAAAAKAPNVPHETPPGAGAPPKPPPGPGTPPPAGPNPLKEVGDFISQKYGQAAAKPGMVENLGKFMQKTSQQMGAKDLGMQPRQVQSMGPGFQGIEKAEALIDYARDKGYFSTALTDIAREAKIKQVLKTSGQQVEAMRSLGDKRGAPPVPDIYNEVKTQLGEKYGVDAPREIKKVLLKIEKAPPTFSGLADLATDLNKAKTTAKSLGQHPGPTTDAANIVSRINNDALRSVLNPQESELYTNSLKDFGAHKQLEQAVAASERRGLSAQSNQRGIFGRLYQEALKRGGYRFAGNVAHRMGKAIGANPSNFKTMPQFFEELAHQTGDVLDETMSGNGMAHGGIVGEVDRHLTAKYGR